MRFTLLFCFLGFALVGCSKHSPDVEMMSRKAIGSWSLGSPADTIAIRQDGSYSSKRTPSRKGVDGELVYDGTWHIEGGFLVTTITNVSGPEPHEPVGFVNRFRLIRIDDHEMVVQPDGQTKQVTIPKI